MPSGTAETYALARDRFLVAASAHGYEIRNFELKQLSGPDGEPLYCDVAFRQTGSRSAVVTSSAVHGVEGFAGSQLQRHWVENGAGYKVDAIHIHALNPYGYAWDRRADHQNIDVNRNFISAWDANSNPGYARYAEIIVPRTHGVLTSLWNEFQLIRLQISPGADAMKDIITKGQYIDPKGMYYGGEGASWSRMLWEKLIAEHFSGYDRIVHLDVHTGLGGYGDLQVIAGSASDAGAALARQVFGEQAAFIDDQGINTSLSSPTTGAIENSWEMAQGGKPTEAVSFTLEFGTYSPLTIFRALQATHAGLARGEDDPEALARLRRAMRLVFAPGDPVWLASVLRHGGRAYDGVVQTLSRS